jgi:hypothetical protein
VAQHAQTILTSPGAVWCDEVWAEGRTVLGRANTGAGPKLATISEQAGQRTDFVLAHELVHILWRAEHTDGGLMRASASHGRNALSEWWNGLLEPEQIKSIKAHWLVWVQNLPSN